MVRSLRTVHSCRSNKVWRSTEEQTVGHMVAVLSEVAVDMSCFQDRLDVASGDCATTFIRCQQCATELGLTVSHSNGSLSARTDIVALLVGGKAGGQLYIDDGEVGESKIGFRSEQRAQATLGRRVGHLVGSGLRREIPPEQLLQLSPGGR